MISDSSTLQESFNKGGEQFGTIIKVRGAFNKFPDFFVQALKIVVDPWKFNMLLLYILWDDFRFKYSPRKF